MVAKRTVDLRRAARSAILDYRRAWRRIRPDAGPPPGMKECNRCHHRLSTERFHARAAAPDGLQGACKECSIRMVKICKKAACGRKEGRT